jgi:hypothetical protein
LEDQTFTRERIEGLPPVAKPRMPAPAPDTEFSNDSLRYQPRTNEFLPGLELPNANAAPLPRPQWERLYPFHLRVGLGRWLTPDIRLHLADGLKGRQPRTAWGLDYRHLSTATGHVDQARFGENDLTLHGRYYLDRHTAYGHFRFRHDVFRYYGDSSALVLEDDNIWTDSLRQRFVRTEFQAGIRRNYDREAFLYDIPLRIRTFNDRPDASPRTDTSNSEIHASLLPRIDYWFSNQVGLGATLEATYGSVRQVVFGEARTWFFLDAAPHLKLNLGSYNKLDAQVGFRISTFGGDDTSLTRFAPVIRASYPLAYDSILHVFLDVNGGLKYQSRYTWADENRWLAPDATVLPTAENIRLQVGARGHFGRVDYSATFFYATSNLMPVFYNPAADSFTRNSPIDSVSFRGTQGQFQLLYEEGFSTYGATLAVSYTWREKVYTGAELTLQGFSLDNLEHYFQVPGFQASFLGGYRLADKLRITSRLNLIGPRTMGVDTAGQLLEQPLFADLNLHAEYYFSPRFSVWVQGNNLLGMEYYRWNGYRERGLDFRLGAAVSF